MRQRPRKDEKCLRYLRLEPLVRLLIASSLVLVFAVTTGRCDLQLDLTFSTLIGAEDVDRAQGIATDADGNIYVAMNTLSSGLPTTPGAYQPSFGGVQDAYFAKFTPDGQNLLWATYLGGPAEDRGYGLRVGSDGSVYAVGITKSGDFPTTAGAANRTYGGGLSDVFVTKFSPDGQVVYSTIFGGNARDWSRGNFAVDSLGAVYVGGATASSNFPITPNAFQTYNAGNEDAFLVKLSPDGSRFEYSSYFGGSGHDSSEPAVHVSPTDNSIYFSGWTNSPNFPVTNNALQTTFAGGGDGGVFWLGDGYVTRLSADFSEMIFSTYLGGPNNDGVAGNDGMAVDAQGNVILIGQAGEGFPVQGDASQTVHGGGGLDGFVSVLSADGSRLLHSTLLGGNGEEEPSGVAIDSAGFIYLSGNTASTDFPTTAGALDSTYNGGPTDAFVTVLTPDLTTRLYSTIIGGNGTQPFGDRGRSVVLYDDHTLWVSGDTNSRNFPLVNATQTEFGGGRTDGMLMKWTIFRPGDVNGDFVFDSADLIQVFASGQYEDGVPGNSDWRSGDWDNDGEFTSADLIAALQRNQYVTTFEAANPVHVPEPATGSLAILAAVMFLALAPQRPRTGCWPRRG